MNFLNLDTVRFDAFIVIMLFVFAILSYLIGNISPAIIFARINNVDIKKVGSRNAGTTNVIRSVGLKEGLLTLILDIAKGFVPPLIGFVLLGSPFEYVCGMFVIIGHIFPVFYKFKGGKGVATALGSLLFISPVLAVVALVIAIILILIFRYVSMAVLFSLLIIDVGSLLLDTKSIPYFLVLTVLIVLKHSDNISRIKNGTENKFYFKTNKKDKKIYEEERQKSKIDYKKIYMEEREKNEHNDHRSR